MCSNTFFFLVMEEKNLLSCVLSRFSCVWLFMTLWTVASQAPLSMGFSRQEYRSGLPFPPPGDLPHPGIEPASLTSPALAGRFFTTRATQIYNSVLLSIVSKLFTDPPFSTWTELCPPKGHSFSTSIHFKIFLFSRKYSFLYLNPIT